MLQAYHDESAQRSGIEQEAIQDALIKRFEYSLEVAWKSCKRYLCEEGVSSAASGSPKSIMRLAAEFALIGNAETWIAYINARQSTSHDYSHAKASEVLALIDDFYQDAQKLYLAFMAKKT